MLRETYFFENNRGIRQDLNPLNLSKDEATFIENLHMTTSGTWSSVNTGYTQVTAEALSELGSVLSLFHHVTPSGVGFNMAQADGKLYTVTLPSGVSTEIASGF